MLMRRRKFIVLLGGAAVAGPVAGWAQPGKVPRIGILVLGNPDPAIVPQGISAKGCANWAMSKGRTIAFEFRTAQAIAKTLSSPLAAELVALKVDIIVGFQTPAVTAAKQATAEIPIVDGRVGDPVGTGLRRQPGAAGRQRHRDVTGATRGTRRKKSRTHSARRCRLTRRVAVLANAPDPFHKPFLENILAAGRTLGIEIKPILVRGAEEIRCWPSPRWTTVAGRGGHRPAQSSAASVSPTWRSSIALPVVCAQFRFSRGRRPDGLFR